MSWEALRNAKGDGGNFIKLKDGNSIEGIFRGEPHVFYQKFGDRTEHKERGTKEEGRSFRFKMSMIVKEDDQYVSKIMAGGFYLATSIDDQITENGIDSIYKVKRMGSGPQDTRYAVVFKKALTEDQVKTISEIPVKELEVGRGVEESGEEDAGTEDIPF